MERKITLKVMSEREGHTTRQLCVSEAVSEVQKLGNEGYWCFDEQGNFINTSAVRESDIANASELTLTPQLAGG